MKRKKIIFGIILSAMAGICHAQENRVYLPPISISDVDGYPPPPVTYTFEVPELRVSQVFIDKLNAILFDEKYGFAGAYDPNVWKYFCLFFRKEDPLNYTIVVSVVYHPGKDSRGFFEQNGYQYCFYGDVPPPGIILGTKSRKQFSYTTFNYSQYPPSRFITYNGKTGKMKVEE